MCIRDRTYVSPYIQTFTVGVTRSLPAKMILDMRYVGTRGVKLHSTINYNEPDFQYNGLMEALTLTRAGGDSPLFDEMFNGLNFGLSLIHISEPTILLSISYAVFCLK